MKLLLCLSHCECAFIAGLAEAFDFAQAKLRVVYVFFWLGGSVKGWGHAHRMLVQRCLLQSFKGLLLILVPCL